jgi:hypothetical protein
VTNDNEELMTRFLWGDMEPEERERVEQRFLEDQSFFEKLCAFEEEMLLAHSREELPEPLRRQIQECLDASPVRRRRFDEVRAFAAAAAAALPVEKPAARAGLRAWLWPDVLSPVWIAPVVALVVLLVAALIMLQRGSTAPPREVAKSPGVSPSPPRAPIAAATPPFFLQLGNLRRGTSPQVNVLRIPPEAGVVVLTMAVSGAPPLNPAASFATVEGAPVADNVAVQIEARDSVVNLVMRVPAKQLAPQDYVLTIEADVPGVASTRRRQPIATRFFSVVP